MARTARWWWLLLLAAAACRAGPDRPRPLERPPAPEEPAPVAGAGARRALFAGLGDVEGPLAALGARAAPRGAVPPLWALPQVERAVWARYARGTGLGPLRQVAAFGFCGHAPLPPTAMADLMLDPAVERHAIDATTFRRLDRSLQAPGMLRERHRVELLGRGAGPFRVDFRFTACAERWDLPDGTVLVRHDPAPDPEGEGVTLYRGVLTIEPEAGGSRVTEMLVLGTDTALPFFLVRPAQREVLRVFGERVARLWREARRRAGAPPGRR